MKIFLNSYLNNNLGDDLMIDIMCKRYPMHEFYISNINELDNIACKNPNLNIVPSISPSKNRVISRIFNKLLSFVNIPKIQVINEFKNSKYDVYMELGGSIFMQVTKKSWYNKIRDSRYIISRCKNNFVVSSNFGPYFTEEFVEEHRKIFSKFDDVIFRDKYSYGLFSELESVRLCPDIVFNLKCKSSPENIVGISVISLENVGIENNREDYINGLVELINNIDNKKVALISFCENEGDVKTCEIIKSRCNNSSEILIYNHQDVEDSLSLASKFSSLICTRFHACILAVNLNIPFLPIIYSKKTKDMLDDIGYRGYRWNIKDGEKIDINKALYTLNNKEVVDFDVINNCRNHFIKLDRILLNKELSDE